jgi:hypothetical protein
LSFWFYFNLIKNNFYTKYLFNIYLVFMEIFTDEEKRAASFMILAALAIATP